MELLDDEYRIFLDDLSSEHEKYKLLTFKNIPFYGDLFSRGWRTDITDESERYLDLLSHYYTHYNNSIISFQGTESKQKIKDILKKSKNIIPPYGVVFHQMYWVVHDCAYFSISRLAPEMHKVNQFFISYLNDPEPIMPHHKIFNFQFTTTSPWFRDYIRGYTEHNMEEVENAPLFALFLCTNNLTDYGREHIFDITEILGGKLDSFQEQAGVSLLRSCISKRGNVDYRKLQRRLSEYIRSSENELRAAHRLPNVGEGYLEELKLYYRIKDDFPKSGVISHGKPEFLGSQHYDIWIPRNRIAVEYQGEQHQRPIDYFGGEAAFAAQKERDERKRRLSIENAVFLFCVEPGYSYPELRQNIEAAMKKS